MFFPPGMQHAVLVPGGPVMLARADDVISVADVLLGYPVSCHDCGIFYIISR